MSELNQDVKVNLVKQEDEVNNTDEYAKYEREYEKYKRDYAKYERDLERYELECKLEKLESDLQALVILTFIFFTFFLPIGLIFGVITVVKLVQRNKLLKLSLALLEQDREIVSKENEEISKETQEDVRTNIP